VAKRSNRGNRQMPRRTVPSNPGGVTLSGAQLTAVLAAAQGSATLATPLPRPPQWATDPFGPGSPLQPSPINQPDPRTGRAQPRLFELPISTNLNVNTAPTVPWRTLSDAADMPLFRKCIERRKSVAGLGYTVTVDPEAVARESAAAGMAKDDVEASMRKQYMSEISRISDWLETPDRKNGYDWEQWASQLMENRLVYDAIAVYPRRTFGGDCFAFEVLDGSTIKPLLDEYGGRPLPPAPFAQQILWGFPRGEFVADTVDVNGVTMVPGGMTTDQLLYERTIIRPKTPYGMSATEIALLDGIMWMRRMDWLLKEYTHGVTGSLLETSPEMDWNTDQWADWATALNDKLSGDTMKRLEWSLLPPGTKAVIPPEVAERYKPEMDLFLVKLVAGDYGLPASEVGFTETGALGASFHEGEADILQRNVRQPDANWISKIATRLAVRQLNMPSVLKVQVLGLESEDEAAADAVALTQVQSGRMTLNEDRARRGKAPYGFAEADMPQLQTGRGIVFLEGASTQGPPGTLIGPAIADPTGMSVPGTVSGNGRLVARGPGKSTAGQQPDEDDEDQDGGPAAKSAELPTVDELRAWGFTEAEVAEAAAYRRWVAKGDRKRPFEFAAMDSTRALAGALVTVNDVRGGRVAFKDADASPKVLSGTGPAGSGTSSW
jgi:hypothetical protein